VKSGGEATGPLHDGRFWFVIAAVVALLAASLGRPPHFDEVNFLVLARGAAEDPWRPHEVLINWQGTTERAFAVLSNPPGIAWWLAPWLGAPVWVQRLAMLPGLGLAAWGAWGLGRRFLGDSLLGALFLLSSPIVLLSATALLPDAPLFALTVAGMAGLVGATERGRAVWPWALLIGGASLFRYSGVALWPLVPLWLFLQRRSLLPGLWVAAPLGLLAMHDQLAYGEVHILAMGKFQSVSNTPTDWGHKAVAAVTMLGGAVVLPVYRWPRAALAFAAVGALAAAPWGVVAAGFGALGGAALAPLVTALRGREGAAPAAPDRLFLLSWALLGAAFLLTLRFTAARYWLPFMPALALCLPATLPRARVLVGAVLGLLLVADDALHARAVHDLAQRAAVVGPGRFTGHWGWQGALEAAGWQALDEGQAPPAGTAVAIPTEAWPQDVDVRCDHVRWEGHAWPALPWLPRSYSREGGANLHANWISGPPPIRTVVPWWFAGDAWEHARVCQE
jgi:4-amino-4-deoxy-L-arabinose transferase-like glycosyltransferase